MVGSPPDIEALGLAELRELVLRLAEEGAALRVENAALREEIARLKGLKGRPKLKPSGMDKKAAERRKAKQARKQARRGRGAKRLAIDEERVVSAEPPAGARFKGYEDYIVQDLVVRAHVTRFRRECWVTPAGGRVVAALPAEVTGHFGAGLRRFVLALYHQGQTTLGRLTSLLGSLGLAISKRQLQRLLSHDQERFTGEARAVLHAGLQTAPWISVDDTGARHLLRNAYTTQIGNHHFTCFLTSFSKSRGNFLSLLRAGHDDYVVNQAALDYMKKRRLAGPVIARLAAAEAKRFADQAAWAAHLEALGIAELGVQPDPLKIAGEGALWGAITDLGLLRDSVILSDDAGQFNVGQHALCWVHAERLIHKLETFCERQRRAKEQIRARLWGLYADLKAYREKPTRRRRSELVRRFDRIFTTRTGFATLDRLLARLHANKAELLLVLERPEVPLNTNASENDIRCQVTRRQISGGTRSQQGREALDAFLGLVKTCQKLGISFWDYLGNRLLLPGAPHVPPLADLVSQRNQAIPA